MVVPTLAEVSQIHISYAVNVGLSTVSQVSQYQAGNNPKKAHQIPASRVEEQQEQVTLLQIVRVEMWPEKRFSSTGFESARLLADFPKTQEVWTM